MMEKNERIERFDGSSLSSFFAYDRNNQPSPPSHYHFSRLSTLHTRMHHRRLVISVICKKLLLCETIDPSVIY